MHICELSEPYLCSLWASSFWNFLSNDIGSEANVESAPKPGEKNWPGAAKLVDNVSLIFIRNKNNNNNISQLYLEEELNLGVQVGSWEPGHGLHELGQGHRPATVHVEHREDPLHEEVVGAGNDLSELV